MTSADRRGEPARQRFDRAPRVLHAQGARRGWAAPAPTPRVGAVLVKGGRVVARGTTRAPAGRTPRWWRSAAAGAKARGADLYTTLEPCDHWGKTPPCSLAILEAGVRRVFVGSRDPTRW